MPTKQIKISVKDKIASLVDEGQFLVCGNNDYEVVFEFDRDWDGVTAKTALFVFGDEPISVPFDGDICSGVAIEGATMCAIGVYAGDLKTTTGACLKCLPSIRDMGEGAPKPPTPEVYDRIMALLDKAMQAHTELPTGGSKGQVLKKKSEKDYDVEWVDDKTLDENEFNSLKGTVNEHAAHLTRIDNTLSDHQTDIAMLLMENGVMNGMIADIQANLGTAQTTLSEVVDGGAFV